jgi:hypothetical protein
MRHVMVVSLAVLALASCGGSGSNSSTVSSSPGPTGATGPSGPGERADRSPPKPEPGSPGAQAVGGGPSFDGSTVRVSFLEKSFFGAKSQVVYFIAKGAGSDPLAQAKACVARYLRIAPSAYCFAFPSERALRFSHVSRRPPAKMRRPCWSAYWGKPHGRRAIGSAGNPAAGALHCPDATG